MIRKLLAASALIAASVSGAVAQGETTATESATFRENNDDASQRLPTAGRADVTGLLQNTDGSQGTANTTENLNSEVPQITEDNNDNVSKRLQPQ